MSDHEELSPLCYALQAVIERNREEARKEAADAPRPIPPPIGHYIVNLITLDGIRFEMGDVGPVQPGRVWQRPIPGSTGLQTRDYALESIRRRPDMPWVADCHYREIPR